MNYPIRAALLVVASLFSVLACHAQTEFPNTPASNQAKAWLEVFNAGDADKYKEFVRNNFPSRAQRADQDAGFREMTGGFELRKVEESTPTKTVALVQERLSDQFARLTLEVEPAEPHRITRLSMNVVPRPAEFALPRLNEDGLINTLRKKLHEDFVAGRFSGAVLLAKNGKTLFNQAYGLSDREKKLPNISKTRFRLGSMNKMFMP